MTDRDLDRTLPAPAQLLVDYAHLLSHTNDLSGTVIDLACGDGRNGIFLAMKNPNLKMICCDRSQDALKKAQAVSWKRGVRIKCWQLDLEQEGANPLPVNHYVGILVVRYLYRPLIPFIRTALRENGVLFYETFTTRQRAFGKPHNPDFLLRPGELLTWFKDWHVHHYFEGIKQDPERAVAQLVCRKTS